jgi:hypothetical protein
MPSNTSNLSVDEQQVAATAKRKEEDDAVAAQATTTITQQEQETLVTAVAATRKTIHEAHAHERTDTLAWEKEKMIARHLKQQLAAAQGIAVPQDSNDNHSVDIGSNLIYWSRLDNIVVTYTIKNLTVYDVLCCKNVIEGASINTFCDVFIKECHKFITFLLKTS